jgi:hypothetical protein
MRIKEDFITNSSSSSFIVAFDKPVVSLEEIKDKIMFIEKATAVFGRIQEQTPIKIELSPECINKLTDEISSGYFEGFIWDREDLKKLKKEDFPTEKEYFDARTEARKKYEKANWEKAEKIAIRFVEENVGKVAYTFSFSDNDGKFWSEMEHGGTFDEFPHLEISHH